MSSPQYQVLARKCRPQRFSEVVGQEHITRTLQNAITQQRVGHAYLFVGSRGIGKTTTARIFAKALNCEAGIVAEPCCKCQSCKEIAAGTSLDVIEIDGASHNKVEHVRDIRDNVQYTPARGRYKIYIIDEVHMLTTQAWNALLKTLEEPPPHVKFFFATTEPHKVLPTIVSRCQRFDLKRLSVKLIAGRLREIADREGVAIDDGALVAIARAADGGMRDAQSIFDQIIAFCGGKGHGIIGETDVIDVFGLASGRELASLAVALIGNRTREVMSIIRDLADRGRDLERVYSDLVMYIRNVMIAQVCTGSEERLDVSQAELADILGIAAQCSPELVRRILEFLVEEESRLRMALNKRIYLEVALVKVMDTVHSVQLSDVIGRLNELRGTQELDVPGPEPRLPPEISLPERRQPSKAEATQSPGGDAEPTPPAQDAVTEPPEPGPPEAEPEVTGGAQQEKVRREPESSGQDQSSLEQKPGTVPVKTLETPEAALEALVESFRSTPERAFLAACLGALRPVSYEGGVLELAYPRDMVAEQLRELQRDDVLQTLNARLQDLTGSNEAQIMLKAWVPGVSEIDPRKRKVSSPEVMDRVKDNPFVQKTLDLFGGEIIDVRG